MQHLMHYSLQHHGLTVPVLLYTLHAQLRWPVASTKMNIRFKWLCIKRQEYE